MPIKKTKKEFIEEYIKKEKQEFFKPRINFNAQAIVEKGYNMAPPKNKIGTVARRKTAS